MYLFEAIVVFLWGKILIIPNNIYQKKNKKFYIVYGLY
jgi:hypothetical protein